MTPRQFDVFLCHSTSDKPAVERIAGHLMEKKVQPWLDKWNLIPGEPWQEAIEEALDCCMTCAVFIGPSGVGPWQNEEMRVALSRRVDKSTGSGFRVIPVLLPGASKEGNARIPAFLARATWVEFKGNLNDESDLHRLISGIRGIEPGRTIDITPARYVIVLEGIYDDFGKPRAEAVAKHLQTILNDSHVTITRIEKGSIVIYLESSRVAFEKLRSMFKDGTLRVVEGLKVLEVREDFVGRTQPSLEQGHIKWFNDAKGFGFISRSNAEDVYVHFSAIQSRGYRSLKEGQPVQFKIVKGPKGWQAENVELLNPPGKTD